MEQRKLEMSEIKNIFEALEVRKIRNTCRLRLTRDTSEISVFRQIWWYFTKYWWGRMHDKLIVFLGRYNGSPMGYGLISVHRGFILITGGLKPVYRGKGIGKQLFEFLSNYTFRFGSYETRLEVMRSNKRAIHLYRNLGFKTYDKNLRVMYMRKEYDNKGQK